VRFYGHVFAVFLDDLNDENWHGRFRDDDSILYPVETYDMVFDDIKEAESLLNDYRNRIPVKDFDGTETWRLRGTRDALPKDYACEVTIPVDKEDPQGNWQYSPTASGFYIARH
jgi:hypothetical protein